VTLHLIGVSLCTEFGESRIEKLPDLGKSVYSIVSTGLFNRKLLIYKVSCETWIFADLREISTGTSIILLELFSVKSIVSLAFSEEVS
jgi:hypothetical protein